MTSLPRLVLASGNAGKLAEFRDLLGDHWDLRPQSEFGVEPIPETGASFLDNALLKARHAAALTGLAALADDSGLEVDALGGLPGVRSARFAGDLADDAANATKLLAELDGVPHARRTARFRCVLAFVRAADDAAPIVAEGVWPGRIAAKPAGSGGFGYDPVFEVDGRTAAELDPAQKQAASHRGQAARALRERLEADPV